MSPITKKPKKIGLTVYLLKESKDGHSLVSEEYLARQDDPDGGSHIVRHVEYPFQADGVEGKLFIKSPPAENNPDWLDFLNQGITSTFDSQLLTNKSVSALLVVYTNGRQFALAFGHGRYMLGHEHVEPRFGIKVCLNSIQPGKIASLDKQTFDANPRLTRTQAAKLSPVADYGINAEQDLLKALVGVTDESLTQELGEVIAGMDSLKIHITADVDNLAQTLATALRQYRSRSYLDPVNGLPGQFAWVDNLSEETNLETIEELDKILWKSFSEEQLENMWLSIPDLIDWSNVAGFSLHVVDTRPLDLPQTLEILSFRESFNKNASLNTLKTRRIYVYRLSGEPPLQYPAYRCIYWETKLRNEQYLLHQGAWFKTDPTFAGTVESAFKKLPTVAPHSAFPQYEHLGEGDYNTAVSLAPKSPYTLLDRKLIQYGGGHSSIEVCDLFAAPTKTGIKGELIHVKRGRGSASLSHLFSQGLVSCTLLASAQDFVEQVNIQLRKQKRAKVALKFPCANYDLVFCIIDGPAGSPLDIPFFSKVSLLACVRAVRAYGFEVSLMLVPESAKFLAEQAEKAKKKRALKQQATDQ